MIRTILGILIWFGFIWWEVRRNYRMIEIKKERPNYWHSFGLRLFFGIVAYVLLIPPTVDPLLEIVAFITQDIPYYWKVNPLLVIPLLFDNPSSRAIIFELSSFYLIFDPWLNKKRGKAIDYRGAKSGIIDPILSRGMWWTLKAVCLIALIYSTVTLWR